MGRPPRLHFEGAFYHVYNRGVEKRTIVLDDRDRRTFFHIFGETIKKYALRLFAYCLMNNHFHLFLQTPLPNLDKAMHDLQGNYSHYFNLRHRRVGALFQGRYKSPIVDIETYAFALSRYIHRNPLKAGMVQNIEDYDWSSYPCYTGRLPKWDWLDTDWLLHLFDAEIHSARRFFVSFHRTRPPEEETAKIEKMKYILGGQEFLKKLPYQPNRAWHE